MPHWQALCTSGRGKSLSEASIFTSTIPQYDNRLFIELQVQYMKIPSSNLGKTCCVQKLFLKFRTIFVLNMFFPCSAKRGASDKNLPVSKRIGYENFEKWSATIFTWYLNLTLPGAIWKIYAWDKFLLFSSCLTG